MASVPVTVLTGFLGSGKTTLLNRILTEHHGQRIAIIENEFGEIGIDHELVVQVDEEIVEMNNGCICCTVRGDLIRILHRLLQRKDRFDRILIETTGMADPGPVAQTFFVDPELQSQLHLDGIVTMVDAHHLMAQWDRDPEVKAQVAFADLLVLNKADLVGAEELKGLERKLASVNGMAKILTSVRAELPLAEVLDLGGFDLDRALELKPSFLAPEYPFEWAGAFTLPEGGATLHLSAGPDESIDLMLVPLAELSAQAVAQAVEEALVSFTEETQAWQEGTSWSLGSPWRVAVGPEGRSLPIQGPSAGQPLLLVTQHGPDEFAMRLVGAGGGDVVWQHAQVFAPDHVHDEEVSSVGIERDRPVQLEKLQAWLGGLTALQGANLYRYKGVVHAVGLEERLVFHGVHMLMEAERGLPWGDKPRSSRMIFIGRKLDREALVGGFDACLA